MKITLINDEQVDKLIAMCKKAYPEFDDILWNDIQETVTFISSDGQREFEVHWFELCVRQLPRGLFKYVYDDLIGHEHFCLSVLTQFLFKKEHPVDYLYDELSKLEGIKGSGYSLGDRDPVSHPKEFRDRVDVILKSSGPHKLTCIKLIKQSTGLGLKESKDLLDSAPCMIIEDLTVKEAHYLQKEFEEAGAKVEIK